MTDDATPMFGPDDFEQLPPELRELLGALSEGNPEDLLERIAEVMPQMADQVQGHMRRMAMSGATGPVDWDVARRVGFQLAADGDRSPTTDEVARMQRAMRLAEHWLDDSALPAPPTGSTLRVSRRTEWLQEAIEAMAPLIEPVAAARARALTSLAPDAATDMPEQFAALLEGVDLGQVVRAAATGMAGLQAGMALGRLSGQVLASHDLGVPTVARDAAVAVAANLAATFDGWGVDPEEVAVAVMLHEEAHRRLFHAVPWLRAHIESLVALFANGTDLDQSRLDQLLSEAMVDVDPEDPESLATAMQRAGQFRLEPTAAQRRVLDRLQGVTDLTRAWARHEALAVAEGKLPNLGVIDEVLRRRRAQVGDGEQVLADLLGLQLTSGDAERGERFVAAVIAARGPSGLHTALAHPENLPDAAELVDPSRWLVRMAAAEGVPDDPASLFAGLEDAPVEASADERLRTRRAVEKGEDEDGDDDHEDPTEAAGEA